MQAMALLTAQGVKEVFQRQKPAGREHLRRLLDWEEIDEWRDARRSIVLDTLHESLLFAVGRGFPWVQVVQVLTFTEELLKETAGCSISDAVLTLGRKLRDYQRQFSPAHLLALCDYFHNTFLCHYRLYQYVLGRDREVNLTVTPLQVCVPPPPLPLVAGVDREVWKHEQQVAELREAEVQKRTHMLLLREALRLERGRRLQEAFEGAPAPPSKGLSREMLETLISEALRVQMASLRELLQAEIQTTFEILDLKLQQKTLHLNAPTPFPPPVTGQPGQDESLKSNRANKGKKAKAKK
uniref:Chromosome 8 open reading frame 74 n=1 Tax=Oryctolagus cuniculus TaxID=9986 RepID=G1T9R1_RABIT|nr:uncharacterized protein C8orf74 homolog [Oryctolagus cuniculus]